MNVATGGFGTEITAQTNEGLKDKIGGAAYLLTGMPSSSTITSAGVLFGVIVCRSCANVVQSTPVKRDFF